MVGHMFFFLRKQEMRRIAFVSTAWAWNRATHNAAPPDGSLEQIRWLQRRLDEIEAANALDRMIHFYASRKTANMNFGEIVQRCTDPKYNTYLFCHRELPILLARNIAAIDQLPRGLEAMPSIREVRKVYAASFDKLIRCAMPVDRATEKNFRECLEAIEDTHDAADILKNMATGVLELRNHLSRHSKALAKMRGVSAATLDPMVLDQMMAIQEPLNEVNRYFITYNFLSRQLLGIPHGQEVKDTDRVGVVDTHLDLVGCVRGAVEHAKQICTDAYGDCPEVRFVVPSDPFTFSHYGATIHYIVTELMKNAFRATIEAHMKRNSVGIVTCDDMPPITVLINSQKCHSHSCVCICDEGMGIPRSQMNLVMSYTFTTAPHPVLEHESEDQCHTHPPNETPLAGYGYGLPMSRMYARCFDGDLQLQSMEGYGTKALLFIKLTKTS